MLSKRSIDWLKDVDFSSSTDWLRHGLTGPGIIPWVRINSDRSSSGRVKEIHFNNCIWILPWTVNSIIVMTDPCNAINCVKKLECGDPSLESNSLDLASLVEADLKPLICICKTRAPVTEQICFWSLAASWHRSVHRTWPYEPVGGGTELVTRCNRCSINDLSLSNLFFNRLLVIWTVNVACCNYDCSCCKGNSC